MTEHFLEKCQIIPAFLPVNMATGANNGDWINLKNYNRCAIVFMGGVGAAGQDPTITVLQAQSNGGSSKALNFTRIDRKQGSGLTSTGTFSTITQAAANTYTNDTMGETQQVIVIDIDAASLDIDNGYDWIQANIVDTGSTSKVGAMFYVLHDPKYNSSGLLPGAIV